MIKERAYVYVLRLQADKWYIGSSKELGTRICEHFAGQGSKWTQEHSPVSVVESILCYDGNALPLEQAKTAEYMMRYGWKNVRGGSFVKCDSNSPPAWFDQSGLKRKRECSQPEKELEFAAIEDVQIQTSIGK